MVEHQRTFLNKYRLQRISVVLIVAAAILLVVLSGPVLSQTGCTGDPCLFATSTGTPTVFPTAGPTPTGTITPDPTSVPMPEAIPFPDNEHPAPTSLPAYEFPDVPDPYIPTLQPIPSPFSPSLQIVPSPFSPSLQTVPSPFSPTLTGLPDPISSTLELTISPISMTAISLVTPQAVTMTEISTTLPLSYNEPLTLDTDTDDVTGTNTYTAINGIVGTGQGVISDVISYTGYLTGEIAAAEQTGTFTVAAAPDWYAPNMPREMADIGWTFELMEDFSNVRQYSINTWATIFGHTAAMPVRLGKNVWFRFQFLGPFGLFMTWLFVVMLPFVFGIRILLFLKNMVIKAINFVIVVINWIIRLIELIPGF